MINTKDGWDSYNSDGIIINDDVLIGMIKDVVDTIHNLERMYGQARSQLIVRVMLNDWQALNSMARFRNLDKTVQIPQP